MINGMSLFCLVKQPILSDCSHHIIQAVRVQSRSGQNSIVIAIKSTSIYTTVFLSVITATLATSVLNRIHVDDVMVSILVTSIGRRCSLVARRVLRFQIFGMNLPLANRSSREVDVVDASLMVRSFSFLVVSQS